MWWPGLQGSGSVPEDWLLSVGLEMQEGRDTGTVRQEGNDELVGQRESSSCRDSLPHPEEIITGAAEDSLGPSLL